MSMENKSRGRTDRKYVSYMGKAGEYAVASQLLVREFSVSWPAVDEGFDLLAGNGCRIQVKSSHIDGETRKGHTYYWFPVAKTKRVILKSEVRRVDIPKLSDRCDVVVFWGIEENRYWIVPSSICDTKTAFILGCPDTKRYHGGVDDMREMRSLGYTYQEIADKYDIHKGNARHFINSGRSVVEQSGDSIVRAYEGRWDVITNFGQPAAPESQALVTNLTENSVQEEN